MKKIIYSLAIVLFFASCKPTSKLVSTSKNEEFNVSINLNSVKDDKVEVQIITPKITTVETVYHLPKIIPGTYSVDNYGKYIDNFTALDSNGKTLEVTKLDDNS